MKTGLRFATLVTVFLATTWVGAQEPAAADDTLSLCSQPANTTGTRHVGPQERSDYFPYPPCTQYSGRTCPAQNEVAFCVEGMIPMVCECQPQYGYVWLCMP